jgi:hypothetical protein
MRGSPQADISLPISPLFLLVLQEIPMKCHILAHFRPISEYFDLLRLLEKCGEAPHPAKTLGLPWPLALALGLGPWPGQT